MPAMWLAAIGERGNLATTVGSHLGVVNLCILEGFYMGGPTCHVEAAAIWQSYKSCKSPLIPSQPIIRNLPRGCGTTCMPHPKLLVCYFFLIVLYKTYSLAPSYKVMINSSTILHLLVILYFFLPHIISLF